MYEFENVSIRMVKEPPLLCDKPVNSPGRAVEVLYDLLHDMDRELLIVVNLKTDMTPINMNIASVGTVNACNQIFLHPGFCSKSASD